MMLPMEVGAQGSRWAGRWPGELESWEEAGTCITKLGTEFELEIQAI